VETSVVSQEKSLFGYGPIVTTTRKVVKEVTEYHWNFEVDYELSIFQGSNPDDKVCINGSACNERERRLRENIRGLSVVN
jgi:hypothetical protein